MWPALGDETIGQCRILWMGSWVWDKKFLFQTFSISQHFFFFLTWPPLEWNTGNYLFYGRQRLQYFPGYKGHYYNWDNVHFKSGRGHIRVTSWHFDMGIAGCCLTFFFFFYGPKSSMRMRWFLIEFSTIVEITWKEWCDARLGCGPIVVTEACQSTKAALCDDTQCARQLARFHFSFALHVLNSSLWTGL